MRTEIPKLERASWDGVEGLLSSYENHVSRGLAHIPAVAGSLRNCTPSKSRAGLVEVFFRTRSHRDMVENLCPHSCEPFLREVYSALLSSFFEKRGSRATRVVSPVIRESAACARWLAGQIYQARLQVWFMTLVVPLFSLGIVLMRFENFCANIHTFQGAFLLALSFLLFMCGSVLARKVVFQSTREFSSSDLSLPGGRERLLRRIGLKQGQEGSILRILSCALEEQGDPNVIQYARLVRFGLFPERGKDRSLHASASQVHEWLGSSLVFQRAKHRSRWLLESQSKIWAEMKVNHARCAAKTNLRLITLMGIFYLPAFFLILWICGTVVSSNDG